MAVSMLFKQISNLLFSKKHPATLVHFVTERCNAKCPFCFVDFRASSSCAEELSLQEIALITKNLPRTLMNVNITGGEPFVRNDITDIADLYLTNSSAQSIFISTNGFFTSRIVQFCEALRNRHPEKTIFFSLSINQIGEKHDLLTSVNGMFENSIATFAAIKTFRPFISPIVSITVSPQNWRDAVDLYDLLIYEQQVDAIQIIMARSEGIYKVPLDELDEMTRVYEKLSAKITQDTARGLLLEYGRNSLRGRVLNIKNVLSREQIVAQARGTRRFRVCQAGSQFGVISANGTVYPCEILDRPIGNLRNSDYDIKKLWQNEHARKIRRWVKDSNCACTYECAISVNILSDCAFYLRNISECLK